MKYICGFIGCGNMGGALLTAASKSIDPGKIAVSNRTQEKAKAFEKSLGVIATTNEDIAKNSKFIFLGVKPQMMADALSPLKSILSSREDRFILVTMAAGLKTESISQMAGGDYPVIRIMPNTPVSIGKGMTLYCANSYVTVDEIEEFKNILTHSGWLDGIPEELIDAGCAVSGCGPAFNFMFLDAMAKGGESCGLPFEKALMYAAYTAIGSAELLMSSDKTPDELKTAVCSPGGATLQGVGVLEKENFKNTAENAVIAAYNRTVELGKK